MKVKQKKADDGLGWLREIKHEIARECNYDPRKLGDLYRQIEKEESARRSARSFLLNDKPAN